MRVCMFFSKNEHDEVLLSMWGGRCGLFPLLFFPFMFSYAPFGSCGVDPWIWWATCLCSVLSLCCNTCTLCACFTDDDIPNPFAADDVMQRLSESDKTKEFMKDPGFLEKLKHLSKDSQNLAEHMADHRVMTALAVLLDVDVKVPESELTAVPKQSHSCVMM